MYKLLVGQAVHFVELVTHAAQLELQVAQVDGGVRYRPAVLQSMQTLVPSLK